MRIMVISDEIDAEIERLEDSVNDMNPYWSGESSDNYELNLNMSLLNMKMINKKILRCGNFLSYALSRYQSCERHVEELIEELC